MIRLINVQTYRFEVFPKSSRSGIPPYIIASHRWSQAESTNAQFDMPERPNVEVYNKVRGFCHAIKEYRADVDYLWIDSACINQDDPAEQKRSFQSAFRWYTDAEACFAHLWDVKHVRDLGNSEWFTRGWTLQELLAPEVVVFFSGDWNLLCHKCPGRQKCHDHETYADDVNDTLSRITGIPRSILHNFDYSQRASFSDVTKWMRGRITTKEEDMAYCLIGIFGVEMPLTYGEGETRAWKRLRKEIGKSNPPGQPRARKPKSTGHSRQRGPGTQRTLTSRSATFSDTRYESSKAAIRNRPLDPVSAASIASTRTRTGETGPVQLRAAYDNSNLRLHQHQPQRLQQTTSASQSVMAGSSTYHMPSLNAALTAVDTARLPRSTTGQMKPSGSTDRPSYTSRTNTTSSNRRIPQSMSASTSSSDRPDQQYAVVSHVGSFVQVFLDGNIGVRLPMDSDDPRKRVLMEAYERGGRRSYT